jgi:CheY-like chemotaxis protein
LYQQFSKITQVSLSKDFIDVVRASSFDVILLDSSITNLDAIAVTLFTRSGKLGVNRAVVIILLAHRSDMTFIYEARVAGVTEIVAKPFSSSALMARLTNAREKPRPFINSEGYTGPCRRTGEVESFIEPPKERIGDHFAARSDDMIILARDRPEPFSAEQRNCLAAGQQGFAVRGPQIRVLGRITVPNCLTFQIGSVPAVWAGWCVG